MSCFNFGGNNCCWIIILIIILFCVCGNNDHCEPSCPCQNPCGC